MGCFGDSCRLEVSVVEKNVQFVLDWTFPVIAGLAVQISAPAGRTSFFWGARNCSPIAPTGEGSALDGSGHTAVWPCRVNRWKRGNCKALWGTVEVLVSQFTVHPGTEIGTWPSFTPLVYRLWGKRRAGSGFTLVSVIRVRVDITQIPNTTFVYLKVHWNNGHASYRCPSTLISNKTTNPSIPDSLPERHMKPEGHLIPQNPTLASEQHKICQHHRLFICSVAEGKVQPMLFSHVRK